METTGSTSDNNNKNSTNTSNLVTEEDELDENVVFVYCYFTNDSFRLIDQLREHW